MSLTLTAATENTSLQRSARMRGVREVWSDGGVAFEALADVLLVEGGHCEAVTEGIGDEGRRHLFDELVEGAVACSEPLLMVKSLNRFPTVLAPEAS